MWRRRRWRRLLNLIDHLIKTRGTWTACAVADDDELLDLLGVDPDGDDEDDDGAGPVRPPLHEYDPVVEALWAIWGRLGDVGTATANAYAKRPQKPPPHRPVPDTALARRRRDARDREHEDLVARVLPGRTG